MIDFWIDLEGDFDRFFVDFGSNHHMANLKKPLKTIGFCRFLGVFVFFIVVLLGCFLDRFLVDFWSIWEAKIDQKSIKICSKINIRINPKNDRIFDRFLIDLGWILGGFWGPKSIKNLSKWDIKND